jgi:tetratricopeptide (TPR) repeat protein
MSEKPTLQPPSQPRVFPSDPNAERLKRKALIIFIVLALTAIAVVVILPRWLTDTSERANVAPITTVQPLPPEVEDSPKAAEAQELLNTTLKLKARLDNEGVKTWGGEILVTSYGEVLKLLEEANSKFDDRLFSSAIDGYKKTIRGLEQLKSSRAERTQRALQAGAKSLDQLDSPLATQHYETALAADNNNAEALLGLQRATALPQILEYITQGQSHENNGSLNDARQVYLSALALDKDCTPAQNHLKRVDSLIEERDFQRAISDAMSAYNQNNITQARSALNTAKKLRSSDAAVRDLDQQIKNTELRSELQRLNRQALSYEKAEQWDKALGIYIRALKIDATAGFAQRGKPRAEKFAELNREIQGYLSNPGELQSSQHRAHARNLYDTALALHDNGPKLNKKTEELRGLVELYSRPVAIVLQSDDMTDVMIYRVGRLGHFLEHSLQLNPGRYKARGARSGYRDVIIEFSVPVNSKGMTVKIACKEII